MHLASYLLMCLIFGTTYMGIKVGIDAGLPPFLFAALRFAIAGPVTLGIVLFRRLPLPSRFAQYAAIAKVGLYSTTLVYAILFWAQQYVSTGMAAILFSASPMLVVLIQRRWHEQARWMQIAGLVAGVAGVALVILQQAQLRLGPTALGASALLLLSGFFLALGSVRSKAVMETGVHPLALNAFQMLFGGLGLLAGSLLLESPPPLLALAPAAWGAVAYLSIIGSVIGFGIYYGLVSKVGPLFPSTWTYFAPVIATLSGALVLGEPVGWATLLGLALVIVGAGLTDPRALGRLLARDGGNSDAARPGPGIGGATAAADQAGPG